LGKDIFEFVCAEKIDEWKKHLIGATDRKTYEIGLKLRKNSITYFDVTIFKIFQGENVHGQVLKLHDITSKKLKEQQLISSNKQLDQVIYKTTHDLRAPLLSALGLVSLAENAPLDQVTEFLPLIRKSLVKLNGFIDEMHHFFRTDKLALQREQIDMRKLVIEELEDHRREYNANRIAIDWDVNQEADFFSDRVRVKTILTNLITNSIKYSDSRKTQSFIRVIANLTSDACELIVEDNGIGIEKDFQRRIFDIFFRATNQSHGTGLGLFIVKDTLDRLGGTIEVSSEPSQGTTFKVLIPNQLYQNAEMD
jgi:signal transduction histidine kinase